jgi:hypothetical protein
MVYKEAADLERLRFEIREPRLEFQEWVDAGRPDVHTIGGVRDQDEAFLYRQRGHPAAVFGEENALRGEAGETAWVSGRSVGSAELFGRLRNT